MTPDKKLLLAIAIIIIDLVVAFVPLTALFVGYLLIFKSKQEILDFIEKYF